MAADGEDVVQTCARIVVPPTETLLNGCVRAHRLCPSSRFVHPRRWVVIRVGKTGLEQKKVLLVSSQAWYCVTYGFKDGEIKNSKRTALYHVTLVKRGEFKTPFFAVGRLQRAYQSCGFYLYGVKTENDSMFSIEAVALCNIGLCSLMLSRQQVLDS